VPARVLEIENHDLMPGLLKREADVIAEEACASSYNDSHALARKAS